MLSESFRNLVPTLLPQLQSYRLPGLEVDADFILPNYQATTLANLPSTLCNWFEIPPIGLPSMPTEWRDALGGPYQKVILLLVDALSLDMFLKQIMDDNPQNVWSKVMTDCVLLPLTSVAPSTTVAALTSLWTGQPPAAHGMLGYELWLKEYGIVTNMIFQSPASFHGDPGSLRKAGYQPDRFLPVPVLGNHLSKHSIVSYALLHGSIAHSTLSVMHFRQTKVIPYTTLGEMAVTLASLIENHPEEHSYIHVYWGDLDDLGHRYGPADVRLKMEINNLGVVLGKLLTNLRKKHHGKTLFLITADHGQVRTPKKRINDLRRHPELRASLTMMPTGEGRMAYLFPRPGREAGLLQYIDHVWPGEFSIYPSSQVLEAGLFGPGPFYSRSLDRIGDWVAIARNDTYWWWTEREDVLVGRHGSLTPLEMLIPLAGIVL